MATTALAQRMFSGGGYTLELPSASWRNTRGGEQAEFYNADANCHLRVRKEAIQTASSPVESARRDREQRLVFLPGFVEGRQSDFKGRLDGLVQSYEFIDSDKHPALGVLYCLEADPHTIYTLEFTGPRDKLSRMRNETDSIARSFTPKTQN